VRRRRHARHIRLRRGRAGRQIERCQSLSEIVHVPDQITIRTATEHAIVLA
jgi:hypothetical protein